ncbi:hypothetical protein O7632_07820 [Solwaraspora sp. WMMD406]|uniref:hypothetical protein n=1 Tax=Solwaraspora sp. WMMD406 TaxID=3016095 RepID=UPI0024173359|nr:hypothetical protein [Solwaraspora sp. WMMD406]MDG4764011.1 hypothetical protein [Solwaraspora sp. WMMD406]
MSEWYRTPHYAAPPLDPAEPLSVRVLVTGLSPLVPSATYGAMTTIVGLCLDEPRFWIRFDEVEAHPLGAVAGLRRHDVVRAVVEPDHTDPRPESWKIQNGSLIVERHTDRTSRRSNHLDRRAEWSMCDLQSANADRRDGPAPTPARSLALVRVAALHAVTVGRAAPPTPAEEWSLTEWRRGGAELLDMAILDQLTRPRFTLSYHYRCAHPNCRTHRQQLRDRDVVAFQQRHARLPDRALWRALVDEFWSPLLQPGRRVALLVGNRRDRPDVFDVLASTVR